MRQVYFVYGGNSVEHDISILSALIVYQKAKSKENEYHLCYLDKNGTFFIGEGLKKITNYEKKKGFEPASFHVKNGKKWIQGKRKHPLDAVILFTHGFHAEDGTVGAFFETLQIPVCYSGVEASSLIQNKDYTKKIADSLQIEVSSGKIMKRGEYPSMDTFPLLIKPNHLGSSIGVKKVHTLEELHEALSVIYALEDDALLEEYIHPLKEYNFALMITENHTYISEIEKTNEEEVLNYEEKYAIFSRKKEKEIPAKIDKKMKEKIIEQSILFYQTLHLKGIVRFDYFLSQNRLILNEVNLIPGSLAYYLFEANGISLETLLDEEVNEALSISKKWSICRNYQNDLELYKMSGK